ncbi:MULTISPECIES: orotate phosphoribosyltransferase [unclassified Haladaptatus]|uniref:orotate phosphoribosyltransferase n=1 Tax=unclassified Haladaptatus TaxID=2622732 RepID=UPI0023E86D9E|nr:MULTISPECIES: orotate phosphoribosyltransferase [unclassified Haladaptatus]
MADIASLIEECGAVKYGEFELASGETSSYYVDKYVFETQPKVLEAIAEEIAARLEGSDIDVIAGPELGAVPLVAAVTMKTGIRGAFIRKEAKGYGTDTRVEGTIDEGDKVALLEDVTTTGGTILETAQFVENDLGATISRLIVVVDRNQGAVENLQDGGFDLEAIVRIGKDIDVTK